MKHTVKVLIKKPTEDCFMLLQNHANRQHWQDGLVSFEHISGLPNKVGVKMKLNYIFNTRKISLIETTTFIENKNTIHFNFDSDGMHHIQKNQFKAIDNTTTLWTCKNEYVPTTFSKRLMLILMPKSIKIQSEKYLYDFKKHIENKISVK